MINKIITSSMLFVNYNSRQNLMLLLFLILTTTFHAQTTSNQSSKVLQVEYKRQSDVTITSKQIDYFIKVKNISNSSKTIDLSAILITCDEGSSISDVVEFNLLTSQGSQVYKIEIPSGAEGNFILRTTKKDIIKSTSWSCIEVSLKPLGLSADGVSVVIRQLNPNASNFK